MATDRSATYSAYRAPLRLVVLTLVGVLAVVGAILLVAGVVGRVGGSQGSWLAALAGLQLVLAGLLGLSSMLPTRATPAPAEAVDGGVRLPLRRWYAVRLGAVWVVLASSMITAALFDGSQVPLPGGVVAVLLALAAAAWLIVRGASAEQVTLAPEGVTVPGSETGTTHLSWTAIRGVQPVARLRPVMVVIPRGNRHQPVTFRLLSQGWPAEALTELLEHYADHPADRHELDSPQSLDRFRG